MKEALKKIRKSIIEYFVNYKKDIVDIKNTGLYNFVKKRFEILILLSVMVILGMISFGEVTKSTALKKFSEGIEKKDTRILSKYLFVDGDKVSESELEPLMKYYHGKEEVIEITIKELKEDGNSSIFSLRNGKFLWRDRYYININTLNGKITSNLSDAMFFIEGNKYKTGDTLKKVIPGIYTVEYKVNTLFGDVSGSKDIDMIDSASVNIEVPVTYITLKSDFNDAKVYINNIDTGKNVSEIINYGPIPIMSETQLYIEKEFPWGLIKSESVIIKDDNLITININMANPELISKMENISQEFYQSVFMALNKNDKSIIVNANDDVVNKIYDEINQKSFIIKNNYEISDLKVKIEKSDFKYEEGEYQASLVTGIKYSVYKKLLPFNKKFNEQMFLITLEYKNGTWSIEDIQKFRLE